MDTAWVVGSAVMVGLSAFLSAILHQITKAGEASQRTAISVEQLRGEIGQQTEAIRGEVRLLSQRVDRIESAL